MAYNPPLQVVGYRATRRTDTERGPELRMNASEAAQRGVEGGQLVWVYGPRRHDLAPLVIDESVPRGGVVMRDIAGVALSEIVRIMRVDSDRPLITPTADRK
jgi:anaerobic selenocysteine-containing dehydrogenase